eukprot:CAMPEP_0194304252 /NCGR_PEP_ID=MMETSP0171-20130528/2031_1 /TAXON_ID=218684 /ORGANISM="Corethron pennatum, Strain L29A3" /LENGTH=78 /DNA_ID=CAMNT_0039055467 /DNA_START=304 /DNA_END=540 /DNA_ORIENTATION=-
MAFTSASLTTGIDMRSIPNSLYKPDTRARSLRASPSGASSARGGSAGCTSIASSQQATAAARTFRSIDRDTVAGPSSK